jgi:transcriptional regulator with XRE-family HTH domain
MAGGDDFPERLRAAVVAAGGATRVAQLSGIPLTTLNNYLAGRSEPKRPALATLADALRRDLGWLATGVERPDAEPSAADREIARAEGELFDLVLEAMLDLYGELGVPLRRTGIGRRSARIHNAIVATARDASEWRRMLDLALALERQELARAESANRRRK